jgi:hypothetical protein
MYNEKLQFLQNEWTIGAEWSWIARPKGFGFSALAVVSTDLPFYMIDEKLCCFSY